VGASRRVCSVLRGRFSSTFFLRTVTFSGVVAIQHVTRGETMFPPPFLSSDVCVSVGSRDGCLQLKRPPTKPWEVGALPLLLGQMSSVS